MFFDSINSDTCRKIIYLCPSTPKGGCQWEGDASDILEHFQDSHKDLLMDSNTIKADVTQDSEHNRLMALEKGLFLVQTKVCVEKAKLWIRLRFLGSTEKLSKIRYSVEIESGKFGFTNGNSQEDYNPVFNVENGVEVDVQAINLISGVHSSEYLLLSVDIHVNELTNQFVNSSENEICLNLDEEEQEEKQFNEEEVLDYVITSSLENFVVSNDQDTESDGQISAIDDDNEMSPSEPLQDLRLNDKRELKDIEESCEEDEKFSGSDTMIKCSNCHHNMIPPIYMCPDGHSVCYGCRNHNCSICDQGITELRNIDLEEHSKTLEYPCRYETQGCTEKCKYDQIRKHEIYCDYCMYKCELCVFEGKINEVKSHFRIAHPSTKMYETMAGIHFPRGSNFVIINNSGVFYCTSRATEIYVEWKVIFCGPRERYFSCEVRVTGKKQYYYPKHYFLKRNGNVFIWSAPLDELKSANVKEKNSMLFISSY